MTTDSPFIPGIELSRRTWERAVAPIMVRHAPGLPCAAGLLGEGSDVLGYDTVRSMDHDWGPRLTVLLAEKDIADWRDRLEALFHAQLPATIEGFPARFAPAPGEPGVGLMTATGGMHRIRILSVPDLLDLQLGVRSLAGIDAAMWLTVPEQRLLEMTAGALFHDDLGEISAARQALAWFPDDVWRYRMAAAWKRIAQQEPFIGRAGEVGDDLGSQIIALSLVRDVMRLALLQGRCYAPYAKWLGTAFARLPAAADLVPWLNRCRTATEWREREAGLVGAVRILAVRHNDLGLTEALDPTPRPFHSRPFSVMEAERFADALTASIADPELRRLPSHLGGIDQYIDSTDALVNRELREALRSWVRTR